jgi:hypothetical protein
MLLSWDDTYVMVDTGENLRELLQITLYKKLARNVWMKRVMCGFEYNKLIFILMEELISKE